MTCRTNRNHEADAIEASSSLPTAEGGTAVASEDGNRQPQLHPRSSSSSSSNSLQHLLQLAFTAENLPNLFGEFRGSGSNTTAPFSVSSSSVEDEAFVSRPGSWNEPLLREDLRAMIQDVLQIANLNDFAGDDGDVDDNDNDAQPQSSGARLSREHGKSRSQYDPHRPPHQ